MLTPHHHAPAFFSWMKKQYPNLKKVTHISPNDATGWGTTQADNDAADYLGFEVLPPEFFERGTIDFKAMITRILPKKPDILAIGGSAPGDSALIIKQARELGFKGLFQHSGMLAPSEIGPIAGWENIEGVLSIAIFAPSPLMPEAMKEYLRDYYAKYGEYNSHAPHDYDMTTILAMGIRKANSLDTDDIVRAIESLGEFEGIFGKSYFGGKKIYGNNHQIIRNCLFSQIKKRELVIVGSGMAWEDPPPEKKWR